MTLSAYTLGSGSSGNAAYIRCGRTELLIDAGLSRLNIEKKLASLGTSLKNITAIFITHEHSDHIKGLPMIAKYDKLPIYADPILLNDLSDIDPALKHPLPESGSVTFGEITVTAVPTWHDSKTSCGYVIDCPDYRLGYLTDLGEPSEEILVAFDHCKALILEANYDLAMLKNGPYPAFLKDRIESRYGHLDNRITAKLARYFTLRGTEHILLAHLSKENNTPACAFETVLAELKKESALPTLAVAARGEITELVKIEC